MSPSRSTIDERMVRALLRRKLAYEKYFKTLKNETDNPAQTAYTALIKAIVEISRKSGAIEPGGNDPEGALKRAEEILRTEYGIER